MTSDDQSSASRRYAPIGKYEILSHIATGGMGVVYRARDTAKDRLVALKVLTPQKSTNPIVLERFRREALRGIRLRHDHLVTIHEFSAENGIYFLAEEFVEGMDLHDYIARNKQLDAAEACALVIQAARALDYLHQHQVVHRDIKPSNLLLQLAEGQPPVVKVTDFGLSRELSDEEFRVTRADFTVGTIDYMSPEQARDSGAADARSDIYSLGCTFFHMLTGRPPFNEGGLTERLYKHAEAEPPDVRKFNPGVSSSVVKVLRRMLAKRPDDRYQTPADLLDDLLHVTRQSGDPSPRPADTPTTELRIVERTTPEEVASPSAPAEGDSASDDQVRPPEEVSPLLPAINEEQRQAAAGQYERAKQLLGAANLDYAIHLLRSSCKLDPTNLTYRKVLRRFEKEKYGNNRRGGWFARVTTFGARARLRSARRAGNALEVLARGEEVLARNPWDLDAQQAMAEAADKLGLLRMATWFWKEVWEADRRQPAVNRALARLYEKRGDFARAIAHWRLVQKENPRDPEVPRKLKDLSARDTLARGQYEQRVDSEEALRLRLRRA